MISKLIERIKNRLTNNIQYNKPISVEIDLKRSKLDANDIIGLADKLFTNKHYVSAEKTFVYGGYVKQYMSLKQVIKHFENDSSVTVMTLDGDKYRCGKKVED